MPERRLAHSSHPHPETHHNADAPATRRGPGGNRTRGLMQRVTGIGGLFFRARDPAALARWYREHLGLGTRDDEMWEQAAGPTVFAPFPEDTEYFGRAEQAWMLNFRVDDLDAMLAQLADHGIAAETRAEWDDPAIGRFARVHDPEGNPVELWEPSRGFLSGS